MATHTLEELVNSLEKPRKIMMMIKAGQAVDDMIEKLIPLLSEGDIIIDGTAFFRIPRAEPLMLRAKGCSTLAQAFPAARRSAARSFHDAGRLAGSVAEREADSSGYLRQGRGRNSVLRLGRRKWRGAFCKNGSQRH